MNEANSTLMENLVLGKELSADEREQIATALENSVPLDRHNAILRMKNQEIGEMYSEIRSLGEQRTEMSKVLVKYNQTIERLNEEVADLKSLHLDSVEDDG